MFKNKLLNNKSLSNKTPLDNYYDDDSDDDNHGMNGTGSGDNSHTLSG